MAYRRTWAFPTSLLAARAKAAAAALLPVIAVGGRLRPRRQATVISLAEARAGRRS
jgi:hypothetical protein